MANKYYLNSADSGLVFDIKEPVGSGSTIQALVKKTESNQQWTAVDGPANQPQYVYLQSGTDGLVVDIKEPVSSGSALQALVKKKENNQLWTVTSAPGNSFSPSFSISTGFDPIGFNISGKAWFPGAQVSVLFIYEDLDTGDSASNSGAPALIRVNLGGEFQSDIGIDILSTDPNGTLQVSVTDSVNGLSQTGTYTCTGGIFS